MDPRQWRGDHGAGRTQQVGSARRDSARVPLRLALAFAVTALALGTMAPLASASPARFTYEVCDSALPGGGVPHFEFTGNSVFAPFQNCASPGGSIGLAESGPASATLAYMGIDVPETPGGFVEAETVSAIASGFFPASHLSHVYENGFPGSEWESQRIFHIRTARAPVFGNGGGFDVVMSCDGNVSGACPGAGPVIAAHYIAATEVDPNAPTLAGVQGSLLAGGVLRGHQTLAAEAHDVGGGLSSLSVTVNGQSTAPQALACNTIHAANPSIIGTVAVVPTPCPTSASEAWTLNTEAPPFHDGANAVQVCASDFATIGEPNTTCSASQSVEVDNSCAASPVSGGELLSAQFTKSNAETLTVGYGKEAEVAGQLATNAGDPVPGATLCVKAQTLGVDSQASTVGTVTTDASGTYDYKVPAGPNREIVIGYRHDTAQVARDVRYYAHARPSLHASHAALQNGERVHFWGQLPGPGRRGRVIVLQANVLGSKRWITFRKATSRHKGVFRASYHFTSTTRATTYRFRAVVPDQAGYPWVQGHSKAVEVRVRP
jgi:hypothetical protein